MINIRNTIKFTLAEYTHILHLHSRGLSGPEIWRISDNTTNHLKNRIGNFYLKKQRCRCVYCESLLREGGWAIEHFAPKGLHGEFTFHPKNLFAACNVCNSSRIKGEKDTIHYPKINKYRKNSFKIIHPYLDNPDEHLFYVDDEKTIFDRLRCTAKGIATIDFFKWDSESTINDRIINARSRDLPKEVNKLILEISTYR